VHKPDNDSSAGYKELELMDTQTSVLTEKLSETDFFSFLTNHAIDHKLSIAIWRLPNQTVKHVILSQENQLIKKDFPIEDLPSGFIFAPFDKEKDSIFLPGDFSFSIDNQELNAPENSTESRSQAWLLEQLKKKHSAGTPKIYYANSTHSETNQTDFENLVSKCISEIEKGTFEKIVPSRTKLVSLPENFNIIDSFQKLCSTYPNALISFVSLPGIGTWLGATPEVLVAVENKTIFKTVALAGTKPFNDTINLKTVAWTQKEIEEQALVERYIISCFKKIRLREYDEHGPKTVVAGNLMHLKSDFTVDMKATNFPQLGSIMLQLLHPTSAVCGMPLESSFEFLKSSEGHDREFYAGYLGPVNINNNINIFVNLRCMQLLLNDRAICYAGAGTTVDSVPEDEWFETELKLNTLLNVLQK
jgi:isochorismate synthase